FLENHADGATAQCTQLRFAGRKDILAAKLDGVGACIRDRRQQLEDRQSGQRLAGAGFADQRMHASLANRQADLVDGRLCLARERDTELTDFQHLAHDRYFLGSKASRTASPIKISSVSRIESEKKALMPSQGACRLALPWPSNSPSEGDPGGRPKPRKSSEVRVTMPLLRINGMNVSVATMALGSMWRNMMTGDDTPSARAARTYSKLRPSRNSARTRSTSDIHENSSMMP